MMLKPIAAVAVLGIALLTMGQSCSYVPVDPGLGIGSGAPQWQGWVNEGYYVYWYFSYVNLFSAQATGKTIDYYVMVIPWEDFERFKAGQPYRVYCSMHAQDGRIFFCGGQYYNVAGVVWVPWIPDFVSGDLYVKVWWSQ
jgi:hypothetical protein